MMIDFIICYQYIFSFNDKIKFTKLLFAVNCQPHKWRKSDNKQSSSKSNRKITYKVGTPMTNVSSTQLWKTHMPIIISITNQSAIIWKFWRKYHTLYMIGDKAVEKCKVKVETKVTNHN